MPRSTRPIRGMKSIRTLGGKTGSTAAPYKAYMRLFTLELEKSRRKQERDSAAQRVQNIDARFREIEAEKAELLAAAGARRAGSPDPAPQSQANSVHRPSSGAFKVRY